MDREIELRPLSPNELLLLWERFASQLATIIALTDGAMELSDFHKMVQTQILLPVGIWVDGELKGITLLEKLSYPRKRRLKILAMAGEGSDEWLKEFLEQMIKFARIAEFDGIEAELRPGLWQKVRKLGYKSCSMKVIHDERR